MKAGLLFDLLLIILLVVSLFSIVQFMYNISDSDTIKCNFLWCEFSKSTHEVIIETYCYENGNLINCSDYNVWTTTTIGMGSTSTKNS